MSQHKILLVEVPVELDALGFEPLLQVIDNSLRIGNDAGVHVIGIETQGGQVAVGSHQVLNQGAGQHPGAKAGVKQSDGVAHCAQAGQVVADFYRSKVLAKLLFVRVSGGSGVFSGEAGGVGTG